MGRTLIIGGAGFIGANLARRVVRRGERPIIAASPDSDLSRLTDIDGDIDLDLFDFDDQSKADQCLRNANADRVYFFASRPRPIHDSPVAETKRAINSDLKVLFNFISAAANADKPPNFFLRSASLAEYGASSRPYRETNRDRPLTPYGAAMAAGSAMLNALKPDLPFTAVSLRLALIYGPLQATTFLIPNLIEKLKSGVNVHIRNPEATRDLLFIDDAIDAFEQFNVAVPDSVDCINICSGKAPSMRQVAETVIAALNADPALVTFGDNSENDGAVELVGDASLAESLFGWRAQTSLLDGLQKMIRDGKDAANDR